MPRSSRNLVKLEQYVKEYPIFRLSESDENDILFCTICQKDYKCGDRSQMLRHLDRKHSVITADEKTEKQLVFNKDLCNTMTVCNIKFNNVKKDKFKKLIKKHTMYECPSRWAIDKELEPLYQQTIDKIKSEMLGQYYWLTIDETKDHRNRKVINVIIGWLRPHSPTKPFLLDTSFVESCNAESICDCVDKALNILFNNRIDSAKFLLLITDGPYYMKSAGRSLCLKYTKLTHVTCIAHALHNVSEVVSKHYFIVNNLISSGKALFVKCDSRRNAFRKVVSKLPPKTVITRWGSWIKAVLYYRENYLSFRVFVNGLNRTDCAHIGILQDLFDKHDCLEDIIFISSTFKELTEVITRIESNKNLLLDSISLVNKLHENLRDSEEESAKEAFEKLDSSLSNNIGFKQLDINSILNDKTNDKTTPKLNEYEISCFRFAPITNAEVERSFSRFKWIFDKRSSRFTEENLKYFMIVNYNDLVDL